jgi:hypothetical protein
MSASVDKDGSDWLDEVLEQYWKQRHGMYNANQDDVDMANREAKDAIANKIVILVLKDRAALKQELKQSLEAQKELLQYLGSDPRTGHVEAVPMEAIQAAFQDKGDK